MGTLLLNKIKKQASYFLQEKYRNARIAFTDVTAAELLAEEATNNDPWGPDARTMTLLSKASFSTDDYWRIVYVLHKRLIRIDWKYWRQAYKTLVLLEFLLTHGPIAFAQEFQCDSEVIEKLGTFKHVDEDEFNWGLNMQKIAYKVLELLGGGDRLIQARLKALKTSNKIKGFGNSSSTTTISSPSSTSSDSSRDSNSSFGSHFTSASTPHDMNDHHHHHHHQHHHYHNHIDKLESPILVKNEETPFEKALEFSSSEDENSKRLHLWNCPPIPEKGYLLDSDIQCGEKIHDPKSDGFITEACSRLGNSPTKNAAAAAAHKMTFKNFSNAGNADKSKFGRQFSLKFD